MLIRGPSGAGKSRLAFDLILAGRAGQIPPTVLIGDDRVHLATRGGEMWVSPAPALAGLIEVRGIGIRRLPYEAVAAVGLVVDLAVASERMPEADARRTEILGISLPRLSIAADWDALAMVLALVRTVDGEG